MKNKTKITLLIICTLFSLNIYSQVTLNNVQTYNGITGANDYYTSLVCDNYQNIYAAGYCNDNVCAYIILDKYNSSGVKLWSKTYRSVINGYDVPVSIALDSSGGVYIAGYSKGTSSSYDFLLIKYNQQGDTLWSRRYNGSANGDDRAIKVAVDKNNSIIIAGNAYETGQGINIVLIKYDLNGNQLWIKKYDGTSHIDDKVNDFSFDKNNFIYVAALSNFNNNYGTFHIIKITPQGDTVWSKSYSGIGHGVANGIIIDDSLNVYATGNLKISQDSNSVFTLKLNSYGSEKWKAYFCGGSLHTDIGYKIIFDESGNVYVAGELTSVILLNNPLTESDGYFIIKYSAYGQRAWVSTVARNYVNNSKCQLKVLNSSSIFLGFVKYFSNLNQVKSQLAKFNSNGDSVWVKTLENEKLFTGFNALVADNSGNLICGSASNKNSETDAALLKYNSSGNLIWEKYYNSAGFSADNAINIGKDYQNNIYVTGINLSEYIFIKYNSSFSQQWIKTYSDGCTRDESYSFSVVDSVGNIYLAGTTKDSLGNRFIILIKCSSSGNIDWQKKYANNPAIPWGICIDKIGNIIIAGTNYDNYNHSALNLLKFSPAGTLLMTTSFNAPYNASIWIYSVNTDFDNNILITGSSTGAMTWKFNSTGTLIWEKYWVSNYVHSLYKLKYDKKNNVYVCGYTGTSNGYDYLTIKYDSSGNQKWANTFNGVRSDEDFAEDLVIDSLGNTYVTGYACNQPNNWDRSIVTIKYDSVGNTVWLRDYHFFPNGNLQPVTITRDKWNNVYVLTGYNYYLPIQAGYLTIKYNSSGDSIWSYTYNSPVATNYAKSFLFVNDSKFYITGKAYGTNTGYDIATLELIQTTDIRKTEENFPSKYVLYQNYPNPFNPATEIKFQIKDLRLVTLKVFDILGKEVETLVNEKLSPGEYEVTFDGGILSSGIYFYSLFADGKLIDTKKMIILK